MRKKYLFPAIIVLFLTSCGQSGDGIQEIHINAEDIIYDTAEENAAFSEEDNTISEESLTDAEGFDSAGYFQEYSALAAPASISGIEFLGKNHDRYLFSFPDNEDTAKKLYNEYGTLLQSDGFTLEEYEGNYIIKDEDFPLAFMGTGYNQKHDHIMLIAFFPEE